MISLISPEVQAMLNLGICVVIENLGVDILIGQPAKIKHEIMTRPHLQRVSFKDINGLQHDMNTAYRHNKPWGEVVRAISHATLYPGETFHYILKGPLKDKKRVMFSPREKLLQAGFEPKLLKVSKNSSIELVNCGVEMLNIRKNDHLGDIREAISLDEALISKL